MNGAGGCAGGASCAPQAKDCADCGLELRGMASRNPGDDSGTLPTPQLPETFPENTKSLHAFEP
eukprot:14022028-Alexandrium_andersonii.AAC.1